MMFCGQEETLADGSERGENVTDKEDEAHSIDDSDTSISW